MSEANTGARINPFALSKWICLSLRGNAAASLNTCGDLRGEDSADERIRSCSVKGHLQKRRSKIRDSRQFLGSTRIQRQATEDSLS